MLGETEALQSLDCCHFLCSDLNLAGTWSGALSGGSTCTLTTWATWTSGHAHATHWRHASANVRVTAHDHVHESHWILLDGSVNLWIVLLEASHELLVKLWVLTHTLCHVRELRVLHQAHQLGRAGRHSTLHTGHATWLLAAHAGIFVAIVGEACVATSWNLVEVDSFKKKCAGEVSVATSQLQCLDALVSRLTRDGKQGAQSLLLDTRRQPSG